MPYLTPEEKRLAILKWMNDNPGRSSRLEIARGIGYKNPSTLHYELRELEQGGAIYVWKVERPQGSTKHWYALTDKGFIYYEKLRLALSF